MLRGRLVSYLLHLDSVGGGGGSRHSLADVTTINGDMNWGIK